MSLSRGPLAILFQAAAPPVVDGVVKPIKPGGYSDSGADMGYALSQRGYAIVTPVDRRDAANSFDWVWPDTDEGIAAALAKGATTLWANTVLFSGHPLERIACPVFIVGNRPETVQSADDKFATNALLRARGLPASRSLVLTEAEGARASEVSMDALDEACLRSYGFQFPLVIKPIRGRGSQGVHLVDTVDSFRRVASQLLAARDTAALPLYGSRLMVEEFLPGEEITVAVMPPGTYRIGSTTVEKTTHWTLPPVGRFQHDGGIAPYSGTVAVTQNSSALSAEECSRAEVRIILQACARAAELVRAKALIRIDCRTSRNGSYEIFDLNMKPNMTGPGRPGRDNQASLTALAAQEMGWSYTDLLLNLVDNAWPLRPHGDLTALLP